MQHVRSLEDVSLQKSWLTIGVFDGVHRGHQEIIQQLAAGAHANRASAVVLTFYPHPGVILGKRSNLKYLSLPDEKADLLHKCGGDMVITHPFNADIAALSAKEFIERLQNHLQFEKLLIGYDFALGRNREGDAEHLRQLGEEFGYSVQTFAPVRADGDVVSSSRIRENLAVGDVESAAQSLNHFYSLQGSVIHGDGRGRKINIPTANIEVPLEKAVPTNGVYACWAWVGETKYPAVTNIGIRPTFTPNKELPNVETHLLDFSGGLYDKRIRLEFVSHLRDEKKFISVDALLTQIQVDITRAREALF